MEDKKCTHEWEQKENKNVCIKCGKSDLILFDTNNSGLQYGIKIDGKKYSVRTSRMRYFFPDEWDEFISHANEKHKIIFETLLITGARIEEAMMIKKSHINIEGRYLTLYTTKVKAKKQEKKPRPRDITLPKQYLRQIKAYTIDMKDNDYIFLNNAKLLELDSKEIKKIAAKRALNVYQIFKRALNKTSIEDKWNLSLHNIRKTTGMWLKAMNVKGEDICDRLGHEYNTFGKHYSSTDRFEDKHKTKIANRFTGVYGI